jgi:hypothetical protein
MRNKSITVSLGGQTRTLKLNLNALAAYEDYTGQRLDTLGNELKSLRVSMLRTLIWALLITDEPLLTINQVGSWIGFDNLNEVTQALVQSLQANMPQASETTAVQPTGGATESPFAGSPGIN